MFRDEVHEGHAANLFRFSSTGFRSFLTMKNSNHILLALAIVTGSAFHAFAPQQGGQQDKSAPDITHVKIAEQRWEFLIESEPSLERANELGADRWDFAGIYGQSNLGTAVSLTLWKRPLEIE